MLRHLIFAATALAAVALAAPAMAADFGAALRAHLNAVSAKDLSGLERTLTSGERLELYFPDGRRTATRAEFVDFHRTWFGQGSWTMRFEPVSTLVTDDLALATVRSRYDDVVDGKPYWSESWLTLAFRREAQGWALVHDQNTRIRTSADARP